MLMNSQVGTVQPQDPTTQSQLQNLQLQQALQQQPQQQAMPQVQSPWQGAAMLVQALTSPQQQQGQGASGSSTTPLQSLLGWLNSGNDMAGGPDENEDDEEGGPS